MKILFTIPHYFRPLGGKSPDGREHGSVALAAQPRVAALTACVTALRELFGAAYLPDLRSNSTDYEAVLQFIKRRFSSGFLVECPV